MFIRDTPEERPRPRLYGGWEGQPLVDLTPDEDNPTTNLPFNEDTYREFYLWWRDRVDNNSDNQED